MKQHLNSLNSRIDVHCHLFNKQVISWRLLIDFVQSRISVRSLNNDDILDGSSPLQGIKRALNFLKTGMHSSSEDVYRLLTHTEKGYAIVPLMFDLDYCMKGSHEKGDEDLSIMNEILTTYHQILSTDREELLRMSEDADSLTDCNAVDNNPNEIDELIQTIDSLLNCDCQTNEFSLASKEDPFLNQEKQLVDLQKKYPGKVFPFYAVDPRRKENYTLTDGSYDLTPILKRLTVNGGHFYGIKLYTPNGYSPADPMLMALYEYCEKHGIPITAHCSGGGFASFAKTVNIRGLIYRDGRIDEQDGNVTFSHFKITDKERVHEKAQMLNHPLLWERVLEKFPRLTLNLAHFGSSVGTEEWSEHILRLMKVYPNLYTDFACVTDESTLNKMYNLYYSRADPSIKSRFLYGSDFYLNLLFIDNMKQYIRQFEKVFTDTEMKEIAEINPRRFLAI